MKRKVDIFDTCRVFVFFQWKNVPKPWRKPHQTHDLKQVTNMITFCSKMEPKWGPKFGIPRPFFHQGDPMATQGSPKGAPGAPKTPFWTPKGHILEPQGPPRAPRLPILDTKRHPKGSILALFGSLGRTFIAHPLLFPFWTWKKHSKGQFHQMFVTLAAIQLFFR